MSLLNWQEVMSVQELVDLAALTHIMRQELEMAAWEADARDGQMGYVTWIASKELFIWHSAEDEMLHEETTPVWLKHEQVKALKEQMEIRGFVGACKEDPVHRRVTFERADGLMLDVRWGEHEAERSPRGIANLVKEFLERPDPLKEELEDLLILAARHERRLRREMQEDV